MFHQVYTTLPESVTKRLLDAAEADRNRGTTSPHPEDTASSQEEGFVTDWSIQPDTPSAAPIAALSAKGRISPTDTTRIEREDVLQRDTGSPSFH